LKLGRSTGIDAFFGAQKPGVLICFPLHQCIEKIEMPPLLFCSGKRCITSWLAPHLGEATITQFVDPLGGFYHLDIEKQA
jgi:hypothetical protein